MYVPPHKNRLHSLQDVAKRLRMPVQSVRRLVKYGRIAAIKIGHAFRVSEAEMQRIFRDGIVGIDSPDYLKRLDTLKKDPK